MLELLRSLALKALGYLAPFAVGWFYTPEKIASDVKFRVSGEGEGVTFEGGELPKVRAWLLVSNLSPFNVEIDRMVLQLSFGADVCEWSDVRRRSLPASKEAHWLVQGTLTEKQVAYIQRTMVHKPETRLAISAFMETRLHKCESNVSIGASNVRFLNLAGREA